MLTKILEPHRRDREDCDSTANLCGHRGFEGALIRRSTTCLRQQRSSQVNDLVPDPTVRTWRINVMFLASGRDGDAPPAAPDVIKAARLAALIRQAVSRAQCAVKLQAKAMVEELGIPRPSFCQ